MARKIPSDAFDAYLAQGTARSYEALAKKYGVSKRSVVKRAKREEWQRRVAEIEARAREKAQEKAVDTLQEVKTRHLKAFKAVELKALESLKSLRFEDALDVVKALEIAAREARMALGEPGDRTAFSIEDTIRREYERWMVAEPETEPPVEEPADAQNDDETEDTE